MGRRLQKSPLLSREDIPHGDGRAAKSRLPGSDLPVEFRSGKETQSCVARMTLLQRADALRKQQAKVRHRTQHAIYMREWRQYPYILGFLAEAA